MASSWFDASCIFLVRSMSVPSGSYVVRVSCQIGPLVMVPSQNAALLCDTILLLNDLLSHGLVSLVHPCLHQLLWQCIQWLFYSLILHWLIFFSIEFLSCSISVDAWSLSNYPFPPLAEQSITNIVLSEPRLSLFDSCDMSPWHVPSGLPSCSILSFPWGYFWLFVSWNCSL